MLQARCAQIVGIDRSIAQVERARQRLEGLEPGQRPQVEHVTLSEASRWWAAAPFEKAIAVNVNAFWVNPRHAIPQLRALLAPGGRAYLVYEPPSRARAQALERDLPSQLQSGGLVVESVRTTCFRTGGIGLCFTASRRSD